MKHCTTFRMNLINIAHFDVGCRATKLAPSMPTGGTRADVFAKFVARHVDQCFGPATEARNQRPVHPSLRMLPRMIGGLKGWLGLGARDGAQSESTGGGTGTQRVPPPDDRA